MAWSNPGNRIARVMEAFVEGQSNKRYSKCNVFLHEDILYSYGTHFPLAWRTDGRVMLNADRSSMTTNGHRSMLWSCLRRAEVDFSSVSESALNSAIRGASWYFADIVKNRLKILDLKEDTFERFVCPATPEAMEAIRREHRGNGVTISFRHEREKKTAYAEIHRIGGLVLRKDPSSANVPESDSEYFVSAMDEGSYFISKLVRPVTSFADALNSMIPDEIRNLPSEKMFRRQGEWFFYELDDEKGLPKKKDFRSFYTLPVMNGLSNRHVATRGIETDRYLVSGLVRHWRAREDRLSKQHATLKLGDRVHTVVKNTTLGDWSSSGSVD